MGQFKQIFEKARELYLQIGIKSVSMDDLARSLGISKKTLYQYVENKEDLVQEIVTGFIEKEQSAAKIINKEAANAIEEMVKISRYSVEQLRNISPATIYDLQKYYPQYWKLFEGHTHNYVFEYIKNNIERGKKEGVYREDVHTEIIARIYISKMLLLVDESVFPLKEYNRQLLMEQFMSYHIAGIARPEGVKIFENLVNNQ